MATGATFGVMALYGITTKKDLTHIGSMLMMGLVGLVFTMLFGMIFGMSDIMAIIVSCVAVFIFVGLVAYDTQKLRHMYVDGMENTGTGQKIAIMGALSLYLDFINIFIHLLHLIGDRR
jgi:FtsH-binding integral membrane protein